MTNEHREHQDAVGNQAEPKDVVALIRQMQKHLVFIEKKIDALMGQQSQRPFNGKRFSKPFRSGGRPSEFSQGPRGHRSRERNYSQERPFEASYDGRPRRFGDGKKPFFQRRKDRT